MNVLKGDIVLVISGSSEKMLYEDGEVLLDVSGSYDEDEIVNSVVNSFLLYSYSCVQSEPIYIPFCFLTFNTVSKTPNNVARVSINPSFKSNVTLNSESDLWNIPGQSRIKRIIINSSVGISISLVDKSLSPSIKTYPFLLHLYLPLNQIQIQRVGWWM